MLLRFVRVPIRAELIVSLPLLRIAQNIVSLVNLLELLFRSFLVLRYVGMMLTREFAKRFLDVGLARVAWDAECGVVILKLNRHSRRASPVPAG